MKSLQTFKFLYNTTTLTIIVDMDYILRSPLAKEIIRETPTGAKKMQIYGNGKYRWTFTFPTKTARAVLTVFNTAYAQQGTYDLTMQEEQDDGTFATYNILMRRPQYTPDALDLSAPVDRALFVEVLES